MSGSFNRTRSRSKSRPDPVFSGTDFSSREGGKISFDPSIRALQEQGIGSVGTGIDALTGATGEFTSNLGDLRSRLFGNQDQFTQARVRPTLERQAGERGALTQDLGRRGIAGSSFGQQATQAQGSQQGRDLADQRAFAAQESIQAGVSLDQLMLQAEQALAAGNLEQANFFRGIADDRARLEGSVLTAFGTKSRSDAQGDAGSGGVGAGSPGGQ